MEHKRKKDEEKEVKEEPDMKRTKTCEVPGGQWKETTALNAVLANIKEDLVVPLRCLLDGKSEAEKEVWVGHMEPYLNDIIKNNSGPLKPRRIGFVGQRGDGKSTLINTILGVHLLPTALASTTTASISEICYWNSERFQLVVNFISEEEWKKEADLVVQYRQEEKEKEMEKEREREKKREAEREINYVSTEEKQKAPGKVKKNKKHKPPLVRSFEEKFRHLWKREDREEEEDDEIESEDLEIKDPHELPHFALKKILQKTKTFEFTTLSKTRELLEDYTHREGPFWPIVAGIKIRGRFASLEQLEEVSLLDIPGFDDGYKGMSQRAEEAQATCDTIFWVSLPKNLGTPKTIGRWKNFSLCNRFGVIVTHLHEVIEEAEEKEKQRKLKLLRRRKGKRVTKKTEDNEKAESPEEKACKMLLETIRSVVSTMPSSAFDDDLDTLPLYCVENKDRFAAHRSALETFVENELRRPNKEAKLNRVKMIKEQVTSFLDLLTFRLNTPSSARLVTNNAFKERVKKKADEKVLQPLVSAWSRQASFNRYWQSIKKKRGEGLEMIDEKLVKNEWGKRHYMTLRYNIRRGTVLQERIIPNLVYRPHHNNYLLQQSQNQQPQQQQQIIFPSVVEGVILSLLDLDTSAYKESDFLVEHQEVIDRLVAMGKKTLALGFKNLCTRLEDQGYFPLSPNRIQKIAKDAVMVIDAKLWDKVSTDRGCGIRNRYVQAVWDWFNTHRTEYQREVGSALGREFKISVDQLHAALAEFLAETLPRVFNTVFLDINLPDTTKNQIFAIVNMAKEFFK